MLDKLTGLAGKLVGLVGKYLKLAKNNLEAVAILGGAGTVGGFLFDDRWMVVACVVGAFAYLYAAKKLKD
jgi:hypothetical protein